MMMKANFLDEVLKWKVRDILNKELLHPRMHLIPDIFGSGSEWYESFPPFVLDEFREQLQQVIEKDEFEGHLDRIDQFFFQKQESTRSGIKCRP